MTNQLRNQKDTLAKLMATEDITIIHKKIPTAYFDVKNRILACPIFKDEISSELYDLFMGHEVGHALYTPEEGLHSALSENATLKGYLNVVEDVRIESGIKNKYQGLRKSFFTAYKELMDMDFFQLKGRDLNKLSLIDRINLTTKVGASLGIQFSDEEQVLLDKCYGCKTWEDVVAVAKEIYEWSKENETRTEDDEAIVPQMFDIGDDEENEDGDESEEFDMGESEEKSDDFDNEDSLPDLDMDGGDDAEDKGKEEQEGDVDESENKKETGGKGAGGGYDSDDGARESLTEHYAHNNEGQFLSEKNLIISNIDLSKRFTKDAFKDIVVGYKKVIKDWIPEYDNEPDAMKLGNLTGKKLVNKNKKLVAHMANEFNRKQTAQRSVHAYTGKTGKLDMNRLAKYQIVDDVFKRATYLPDGKNHGVTVLLDWSGSISSAVRDLLEQSLILAEFCRKVNIPYRVYLFSDSYRGGDYWNRSDESFLIEILSNEMNNRDNNRMLDVIGALWNQYYKDCPWRSADKWIGEYNEWFETSYTELENWEAQQSIKIYKDGYRLGGTPLDQSLVYLRKLLPEFNKTYGLEKSILTVITDGYSHRSHLLDRNDEEDADVREQQGDDWRAEIQTNIIDPYNKKVYALTPPSRYYSSSEFERTQNLLEWLSDTTGVTVTGYFALERKSDMRTLFGFLPSNFPSYGDFSAEWRQIGKEGMVIECKGYNKLFITKLSSLGTDGVDELDDDLVDAKKTRIMSAFKKNQKSKTTSRFLTNEFIKEIA